MTACGRVVGARNEVGLNTTRCSTPGGRSDTGFESMRSAGRTDFALPFSRAGPAGAVFVMAAVALSVGTAPAAAQVAIRPPAATPAHPIDPFSAFSIGIGGGLD